MTILIIITFYRLIILFLIVIVTINVKLSRIANIYKLCFIDFFFLINIFTIDYILVVFVYKYCSCLYLKRGARCGQLQLFSISISISTGFL